MPTPGSPSYPCRRLAVMVLTLWCLVASVSVHADDGVLSLADFQQRTNLLPHVLMWQDADQQATIDTLPPANSPDWQKLPPEKVNFGNASAAFWMRISLTDLKRFRFRELSYIRLNYAHLDEVDLYLLADGNLIRHTATGDTRPFANRAVEHRTFLLPLTENMPDQVDVLIRVASQGPLQLPLDLVTRSALDAEEKNLHIWFGVYFGIMAIMFLYNGFIFLFVRDTSYLLYLLYILATATLQFTLYGFSFQYLWPESTTLNNLMILLLTGIMPFTAIAFVWRFIDLWHIGDRYDIVAALLILTGFTIVLGGAFSLPYMMTLKIAHIMSSVAVILGFYVGVKYWIKGIKAARIFALAWFIYMVFIVYYLLGITATIQPDVVSIHALEIGSALEVALLSLAFADRLNSEKEMRLKAQQKLNEDLDRLVRERTEELEKANQRLKLISNTDGLTHLCNRRHFEEVFSIEFQRAYRDQCPLTVIMLDVDHFKSINDNFGHPFGDACLQQVAELMGQCLRRPPDVAARYGGEEFIALLPGTDLKGALHVAESIRQRVEATLICHQDQQTHVTASLGVMAAVPGSRDQRDVFLQQADAMLYQAKHAGRNQVVGIDRLEQSATSPSPSSQTAG